MLQIQRIEYAFILNLFQKPNLVNKNRPRTSFHRVAIFFFLCKLAQFYIFSSSSGLRTPEDLENLLQEKDERIRVSLTFFKHQSMKNICVHFKRYARTSFALTHCIMNGLHSCYLLRNLFYTNLERIRPLSKVWNTVFWFIRQLHKHTPLIFIFISSRRFACLFTTLGYIVFIFFI